MTALREGLVLRGDAKVYHVEIEGETIQAAPRGKLFENLGQLKSPVAVGDSVLVSLEGDPPGVEEVLPRNNYLSRVASSHDPREQVLVSNVDQLIVVGSLKTPGFSSNRTDRILAACQWSEIPAVVLLNKVDLDKDGEAEFVRETYEAAGYPVVFTSATEDSGLETLRDHLAGKRSVLYGASGAGKSTLINALYGLDLRIGRISRYWQTGKHTTSYSRLIHIDENTSVIDTPGIRVFRPFGLNQAQLRFLYPEFMPYQGKCRFPDCKHDHEPGCALADAVEDGELASSRYLSYVEMLDELVPPPEEVPTVGEDEDPLE